jgi:hypothetical protein
MEVLECNMSNSTLGARGSKRACIRLSRGVPRTEISLSRWLPLGRCESPLRPGASRRVPSRIDCLLGHRVRRRGAGLVLRVVASRAGVPSFHRIQRLDRYCFSYTAIFFTFWPLAFVPVIVSVIVLPSLDTTRRPVVITLPDFFRVVSTVWSFTRLSATAS